MAIPFRLKPDDAPELPPLRALPVDPQAVLIAHADSLRVIADEAWRLRNMLSGQQIDTPRGRSRAQARAIELCELLDLTQDHAESLSKAMRLAGLLSTIWSE